MSVLFILSEPQAECQWSMISWMKNIYLECGYNKVIRGVLVVVVESKMYQGKVGNPGKRRPPPPVGGGGGVLPDCCRYFQISNLRFKLFCPFISWWLFISILLP